MLDAIVRPTEDHPRLGRDARRHQDFPGVTSVILPVPIVSRWKRKLSKGARRRRRLLAGRQ